VPFAAFEGRDVEPDLELAFLVGAVLAFDALLAAGVAFLVVPRLVLDLVFFSEGSFLPAYVFLGGSAFFVVGDLVTVLGVATDFLAGLVEPALADTVFDDGALRPEEDFVVVDFAGTAFAFGLAAVFDGAFAVVVVVFEVFEAGLFSFASSATLGVFGASFTRPDGPLGSEKTPFSAPTAIALLS